MPRVLMVGYWYPPLTGAAAQRLHGFAKYLPTYGIAPWVLTSGAASKDDPPDVLRVADPLGGASARIPDYQWPVSPSQRRAWWRGVAFPDRFALWRRRARRSLLRHLPSSDAKTPDVVWATFPPASAASLGADLARTLGAPFVLDMRDLWFGPGGYEPVSGLRRRLHARMERRVTMQAAAIVTVSDAMATFIAERCGIARERIATISNGFDAGDVSAPADAQANTQASRFTLAHVGAVIPRNRPDLFLDAIAHAPQRAQWRGDGLEIRFVGNLARSVVERPEFAGLMTTTGLVPRSAAQAEMHAASALLLLVGDYVARWGHNAKLFDYLRAGRPILCLEESPGSNDRRLLEELARDRCVFGRLGDPQEVRSGIDQVRGLASQCGPGRLDPPAGLERYDRATLAGQLAAVLRNVVAGDGGSA